MLRERESTVACGVRSNRHACCFHTTLGGRSCVLGGKPAQNVLLTLFGMTRPRRHVSSGMARRMPISGVSTRLPPAPGFVGGASDWSGYP
jgi:hypothetical protein